MSISSESYLHLLSVSTRRRHNVQLLRFYTFSLVSTNAIKVRILSANIVLRLVIYNLHVSGKLFKA